MIPPPPDRFFAWQTRAGLPVLVCTPLAEIADHFFTTRSWLLGIRPVDEEQAWGQVDAAMNDEHVTVVRMRQVHGAAVAVADATSAIPVADILLADDPNTAAAVQTADCVPLLIADRRSGAVAAAHAGWRGLAAGVPGIAVAAMRERYGSSPSDLIVAAGPSIGGCCYQVGVDVHDALSARATDDTATLRWFSRVPLEITGNPPFAGAPREPVAGRWFLHGWHVVNDQLVAAGVRRDAIFQSGLCTASHPAVFCSYRRDGGPAGRLAGVIRGGGSTSR
jgi:YfiH family protein